MTIQHDKPRSGDMFANGESVYMTVIIQEKWTSLWLHHGRENSFKGGLAMYETQEAAKFDEQDPYVGRFDHETLVELEELLLSTVSKDE